MKSNEQVSCLSILHDQPNSRKKNIRFSPFLTAATALLGVIPSNPVPSCKGVFSPPLSGVSALKLQDQKKKEKKKKKKKERKEERN